MLIGKTSFKISGTVGIIILLLGITILFGLYQMSKVSDEIVMISQAYEPLQDKLREIKFYQSVQFDDFEKIKASTFGSQDYKNAVEQYWTGSLLVKSNIQQAKRLAESGSLVAPTNFIQVSLTSTHQAFLDIEQSYNELETLTKDSLVSQDDQFLFAQISSKNQQLLNEIDGTSNQIKDYNEQSINAIEEYERVWLFVQIGIIVVVGGLAIFLRRFINQINTDLKTEIESKTAELRGANKKLQELDRKKNEFISIASHELKSPIQPIFGFAELAKSGDMDQEEAWDGVTTLAKKLQELATDILDVTRIESNRLSLYPQKFSMNNLVKEVTSMTRTCLKDGIEIVEDLGENVEIEADKQRVEQVLRNIIVNAVKFTKNGAITVRTHLETDQFVCTVSDTGMGIPKDVLPCIFEKFATKSLGEVNTSGNGLGLFLCKGIIDAHGGKINASNNPHGGATFEFSLPLTQSKVITLTN